MTLSPGHVMALAAIESHERLYLFEDIPGYRASWKAQRSFEEKVIEELVAWGLAHKSAVHVRGSKGSVTITAAGQAKLLAGPRAGAA